MKPEAIGIPATGTEQLRDAAARDAFTSEGGRSGATPETRDADARARGEVRLMRSLFISKAGIDYMFAGFRYVHLADAVTHARRYVGHDAIGEPIMLRPADARD